MLWVLDGRAGHAGGNSGRAGICKHTYVNITRIDVGGTYSLLGAFGRGFGQGKNIFRVYYNNKNLSCPFPGHWGAGRD